MTLGEKLKILRCEKQLNTRQLSKIVSVSSSMISKWERDINPPKLSHIKKFADYFNISLEELLNDKIDI
ncbi:MAG: helix-turn-helix domain-containing protein [Firmicutes bacterium]|nr:helix-turn-helix domain-containing protein [Bacillota bacterium]